MEQKTVVHDQQIVLYKEYGYANVAKQIPVNANSTLFRVSSISKTLTATEREVLNRIALEMTNKEIAQDLAISQRTVEYHITSITQKFGVKSRIGAVVKGYQAGILGDVTLPEKR
ncbi:LuxR C-terminal-related transcriptional regulator [Paenibacillus sp. Z3-2]